MTVRLNITMDADLYQRLKTELPPKRISAFINDAVRSRLAPAKAAMDAAYKSAGAEPWRRGMDDDWAVAETEGWPR
jgi:post-segregation antitoxin (ccd killing protein)